MTICVWVVFKSKVEKNLTMIAVLKSVEGQASCTDERYLYGFFRYYREKRSFFQPIWKRISRNSQFDAWGTMIDTKKVKHSAQIWLLVF